MDNLIDKLLHKLVDNFELNLEDDVVLLKLNEVI